VRRVLGVAVLGAGAIARAHVVALKRHVEVFPDAPAASRLVVLAGRDAARTEAAARRLGAPRWTADWRGILDDPEVGALINAGPNDLHADPSIAALAAGRAVLCEKPLARTAGEAERMAACAQQSAAASMAGFNYRFVPAVLLARRLICDGALGRIYHFRGRYSDDSLLDPATPHTWRHDRRRAGSGVVADLASHVVDLAHFLVGPITAVTAAVRTYTPARPAPGGAAPVTVEDVVAATLEFQCGALGTLEAGGMCPGRKNFLAFEVNGRDGTLAFNLERMNELQVYCGDGRARGLADVLVTEPDHPFGGRWWPPGHILGWEHTFVHQWDEFVRRVTGTAHEPVGATFADGLAASRVCDALLVAADTGRRVVVAGPGSDARKADAGAAGER
jgi:predicted dehydrogenase